MPRRQRFPEIQKKNKFVAAIVDGKNRHEAARAAGYSDKTVPVLMANPQIQSQIESGLSDAAISAGVSRAWVITRLKEVAERCMQSRPVLDKMGRETGLYVFDASGANRSLELIGKHLRVFGDDASATAQLGANVLRLLAQEAVAGRTIAKPVDADIVPTRATVSHTPVSEQERVPSTPAEGEPQTSVQASASPPNTPTHSAPVSPSNDPPTL